MNTSFWIELSDDAAQNVSGGWSRGGTTVYFKEQFYVEKYIKSNLNISGNVAVAAATSNAVGYNTVTQTYTGSSVYQGYSSSSTSGSVAAAA